MKNVTIYTTPTCHFCNLAKDFFDAHNIEYTAKDVSTDRESANEMITRSGQMGVPAIFIDEDLVVGFNEPRIKELLAIQ